MAEPQTCLECHTGLSLKLVSAWRQSKHAARGVGCADCHGSDHSTIFARQGKVSAGMCGTCHAKQLKEFDQSLHAAAVDFLRSDPKFVRLPPSIAKLGCMGCHQIGAHFEDGSRGQCNACHSSHSFSVEEARRPEACGLCHTGPDHSHMAMWQVSKHGQLYAAAETRKQAPTCVTCHMPNGTHHTGVGLSLGQVGSGAVLEGSQPPVKMRTITEAEARKQRAIMVQNCVPCHSSRFATDSLSQADTVKKEADAVLLEAVKLITQLYEEGILRRGLELGSQNTSSPSSPHSLVLGSDQLYDGLSPIEQRFFDMFKFHHATTFKGAYHHSPDHTHNEGFLRMKQDLTYLSNEASRLRAQVRADGAAKKVSP